MSVPPNDIDLLKSIIYLSSSFLPIEAKLDSMLRAISDGFESDRCLFLGPSKIQEKGFFSHLVSKRTPLWVDGDSFFQAEGVLSEEKDLLCPSFACIPLCDKESFQGILYIGFHKNRKFSPKEVDLLLLIAKEMEVAIQNASLHQKTEEAISDLTALIEMGKAITSTLN